MRARLSLLALAFVLAACPSDKNKAAPPSDELASQVRTQLAERERKLTSYRFHGVTTDLASNQSLGFKFAYRSPGKMRGETEGAQAHVFVFDGSSLKDLDVAAKKLTTFDLSALPKDKADAFLHQIFAPFVPEGFRAPLLPATVTAAKTKAATGDRDVAELKASVADGAQSYAFTFRFGMPAMDLMDKAIQGPEGASRVEVTQQTCDAKLGLCFPSEVVESHDGKATARTVLSDVAINGQVADAEFVLAVPPGGTEEKRSLAAGP
ncbi:MAG: hypothetical protein JST54_03655 [Deltaproteobacteria bacterium]|nr:hypothetical protein [Deltaproteobacteria bacterium]